MKKVKIREPFHGAGSPKIYNWTKDGFAQAGIGLRVYDLKMNKELAVYFGGVWHTIDCDQAMGFAAEYGSFETRRGVELAIISTTIFL